MIKGVELEENNATLGVHWESRILLGEYMTSEVYQDELYISEITLALLEDSGWYQVNYYTGGLMRFGKNKGCKFVEEKCVQNFKIDPNFENEFFDSIYSNYDFDSSCSSGRQSRAYFSFTKYITLIPDYYRYFNNESLGGYNMADYCPVSRKYNKEEDNGFFVGKCSNLGFGDYGSQIFYLENEIQH